MDANERKAEATEEHLRYLDELRESGATNMFGPGPCLEETFGLDPKAAREILACWMRTFSARHPREDGGRERPWMARWGPSLSAIWRRHCSGSRRRGVGAPPRSDGSLRSRDLSPGVDLFEVRGVAGRIPARS